jgi:hypothetical protein
MMGDLVILGTVSLALFAILWISAWGFCFEFRKVERGLNR